MLQPQETSLDPIRIRVCQIYDFGSIVSIAGFDAESNTPLMIHIDHRPLQTIWNAWRDADFPQPVLFRAQRLMLDLDLRPSTEGSTDRGG
jgi:hypothetical protein